MKQHKSISSSKNKLTEGSILKSIIILIIPIILGNLMQTAYQIIDTFWVGRLGAEAVAAVSLSFPIIMLIISFTGGIGLAGAVFVSQYKGRGDYKKMSHITGQTFLMAFVLSLIFSAIGFFLTPLIITWLGAEPEVIPGAVSYLRYSFLVVIFVFGFMVFQSVIRGAGDAKTPFYIALFTVLLNLVLDPLLIFGYGPIPAFEVAGAAIATLITQGIALFMGLFILIRGKQGIKLGLRCFEPDPKVMKKIIKLGLPTSFEHSSRSVGMIIMTALVATFGTITLASYGIGMRIFSLVIIPSVSLSITNSTLIGQNIGAGKADRANKITKLSTSLGFVVLAIIGILLFIFAKPIVAIFVPGEPEVIAMGTAFVKIISFAFGLIVIQMGLFGAFRGAGNTKTNMYLALATLVIQVSLAIILSRYTSLLQTGLWLSYPLANIFGALAAIFIYLKGDWIKKQIIESKKEVGTEN